MKHLIRIQTGCPKQEKTIPPMAADTIITTRSDINLRQCKTLTVSINQYIHKTNFIALI